MSITCEICSSPQCVLRHCVLTTYKMWGINDDNREHHILIHLANPPRNGEEFSFHAQIWKGNILMGEYDHDTYAMKKYFGEFDKDTPPFTGNLFVYFLRRDKELLERHGVLVENV